MDSHSNELDEKDDAVGYTMADRLDGRICVITGPAGVMTVVRPDA